MPATPDVPDLPDLPARPGPRAHPDLAAGPALPAGPDLPDAALPGAETRRRSRSGRGELHDELRIRQWFAEGRRYQWMTEEYERLHGVELPMAFWGNYRRRNELTRAVDDTGTPLIPWRVATEHRWAYHLALLRMERRRVEGRELSERDRQHLAAWKQIMRGLDLVVVYDPATEEGFSCEPRRAGDDELVRPPAPEAAGPGDEPEA